MITGADAITTMRNLDDIIRNMRDITDDEDWFDCSPAVVANEFARQLEQWRNDLINGGGVKPVTSYTELLSNGDSL